MAYTGNVSLCKSACSIDEARMHQKRTYTQHVILLEQPKSTVDNC